MGTLFVGLIVLLIIFFAARSTYRAAKQGNICGCGCKECKYHSNCSGCAPQNTATHKI